MSSDPCPTPNPSFSFSPELFQVRALATEILADNDIVWFVDYKAIDIAHDDYGIEIEGIPTQELAKQISSTLKPHLQKHIQPCQCSMVEDSAGWRVDFYRHKIIDKGWTCD
tara:strand:+ start:545 stop:877 length:333 start_codon:yes stop_codon:yes gene_type:complete